MTVRRHGYFRVRRGFSTSGFTLDLSSDSARMAVIRLWDQGKAVAGSFASEAQLREVMGRYYRFIPELRAKGWMDGLDIHDWDEDQANPDVTAAERQRRRRAKLGTQNDDSHGPRHARVTRDVTGVSRGLTSTLTSTETSTETPTPRTISKISKRAREVSEDSDPDDDPPSTAPAPRGTDVDPDDPPPIPAATRATWREQVKADLVDRGFEDDHGNAEKLCVSQGYPATVIIAAVAEAVEHGAKRPLVYIQREGGDFGSSSVLSRAYSAFNQSDSTWAEFERTGRYPTRSSAGTGLTALTDVVSDFPLGPGG